MSQSASKRAHMSGLPGGGGRVQWSFAHEEEQGGSYLAGIAGALVDVPLMSRMQSNCDFAFHVWCE